MALIDILQQKEDRLENIPAALAEKTEAEQKKILKELIRLLDSLERDGGKISLTTPNIAKIQEISELLTRYIFDSTDYTEALTEFAKEFNVQAGLNQSVIREVAGSFEDKEVYVKNLQQSQKQAIELLGVSGVNDSFIQPMKEILQASITGGATFADTVNTLSDYVLGTKEKEGAMLHHVKQVAFDAFAFADRQYLYIVSNDLGFEYYQYFGGKIADSRYFCAVRSNNIYHKKEVEEWGEKPSLWNASAGSPYHGGGRIAATNKMTIFTFCGGYNCRHQIVPVAVSSVPKSVINRAQKKGYI